MRKILLTLVAVAAMGAANAQVPDLNPPKELEALTWLKGTWSGSASMSFGGIDLEVTSKMTVSMDGQFVKVVSTNDYGMIQATETMFVGYDASKAAYISYAFTNMSPMPRRETGKFVGESFETVSDPWEIMGQAMVSKTTLTKVSESKLTFKLELKAGDAWEKATEMTMTKE